MALAVACSLACSKRDQRIDRDPAASALASPIDVASPPPPARDPAIGALARTALRCFPDDAGDEPKPRQDCAAWTVWTHDEEVLRAAGSDATLVDMLSDPDTRVRLLAALRLGHDKDRAFATDAALAKRVVAAAGAESSRAETLGDGFEHLPERRDESCAVISGVLADDAVGAEAASIACREVDECGGDAIGAAIDAGAARAASGRAAQKEWAHAMGDAAANARSTAAQKQRARDVLDAIAQGARNAGEARALALYRLSAADPPRARALAAKLVRDTDPKVANEAQKALPGGVNLGSRSRSGSRCDSAVAHELPALAIRVKRMLRNLPR